MADDHVIEIKANITGDFDSALEMLGLDGDK
jgi:hypothetical protein